MRSLSSALPEAVAALLRDVPLSPGKVSFAWKAAVGPGFDRVTSVCLEGRTLLVDAENQHWAREITRSSGIILARLQKFLGPQAVTRVEIRVKHM
jgi:hypothetical protein